MNRDLRFEDLKEYANEFACSIAEAARDIVFNFFCGSRISGRCSRRRTCV